MLIGTGIVIAGFTLAMMLVMAIDSALYIMGGILVALSIPLMLIVASRTIIWSLVKQMRVCLIPLFHRLHRRTALER